MSITHSATLSDPGHEARRSLDDLINRAIAYKTGSELEELLSFARRFPYIAPFNAMLLHVQNPGIQFALSAVQWERRYKRQIRPGARPYVILRTMGPVAFVFDLSDTEPINPAFDRVPHAAVNPFPAAGEPPKGALQRLKNECAEISIGVVVQDYGTATAGVAFRRKNSETSFLIQLNSKHGEAQQIGTLAHELGHILCGHVGPEKEQKIPDRRYLSKASREFEAEAVAFLVTDRLNLNIGSDSYLACYLDGTNSIPSYSLDTVLKVAGKVERMLLGGSKASKEHVLVPVTPEAKADWPEQRPIPPAQIPRICSAIAQLANENTHPIEPAEFIAMLTDIRGDDDPRQFVTAAWDLYKASRPAVTDDPDWPRLFADIAPSQTRRNPRGDHSGDWESYTGTVTASESGTGFLRVVGP